MLYKAGCCTRLDALKTRPGKPASIRRLLLSHEPIWRWYAQRNEVTINQALCGKRLLSKEKYSPDGVPRLVSRRVRGAFGGLGALCGQAAEFRARGKSIHPTPHSP